MTAKITSGLQLKRAACGAFLAMALAAPNAVSAGSSDVSKVLNGYEKTGESVNCLRHSMVRDADPIDDYMILFEVRGGAMFLNELNGRCNGLGIERRFSYRTTQAQICEGDIISVTDSFGNVRGSCSLGEFQALMDAPTE